MSEAVCQQPCLFSNVTTPKQYQWNLFHAFNHPCSKVQAYYLNGQETQRDAPHSFAMAHH